MKDQRPPASNVALVDLVNRVMDRGVVVHGEVVISVADIELLYLNVNLLLSSVETLRSAKARPSELPPEQV